MKKQNTNPELADPNALLAKALAAQQQGNFGEAEAAYQQLLISLPGNPDILLMLGIIKTQQGNPKDALGFFDQAIAANPNHGKAHHNRADALALLKQNNEALKAYDQAIALNPGNTDSHNNRGSVLCNLKRYHDALISSDKSIALNPNNASAYHNRGVILQALKQYEKALENYNKAIAINPNYVEAYHSRGTLFYELEQYENAMANYDKAIAIKPDYADTYNNRSILLFELERYSDALADCNKAIILNPSIAEAYNMRAIILQKQHKYKEALADSDRAIAINSQASEIHDTRAVILQSMGEYDAALAAYHKATALNPDNATAFFNMSLLKLLLGEYEEGWKIYEWRWKTNMLKEYAARNFGKPLWLGKESLHGKTILLHTEQGFGDILQFCRYVPMVAAKGAKVVFEPPPSVALLASTLEGNPLIVTEDSVFPAYDFHTPLMSLPLAFGTTVDTIPGKLYLSAPAEYIEKWKPILDDKLGKEKLRVGLCWAGGIRPENPNAMSIDAVRSLQFSQLKPLLDYQHVAFVSLQLGPPKDQLDDSRVLDISSDLKNWSDTAAVVSLLDLVITVDTSVCHLVGALGKKFWLLNRYETCWRWFLDREDSPWYPTAKIFRQPAFGDWESVINRMKKELADYFLKT